MPRKKTTAAPKKTKSKSGLGNVRSVVGKVLKDNDPTVTVDYKSLKKSRPHIPTGSVALDYLIGGRPNRFGISPCPGWPRGGVSNIYGHESSGKTTVALFAAAEVCKSGGQVCFIDWEHAIDLAYARSLGVPVDDEDKFYLVQPNTLEDGLKVLWVCASQGVDLIVLDSVSAGVPAEIFGQKIEDQGNIGRVGLQAAKWSNFLPKVAAMINQTGSHVMGISQLRKKINTGGYGGDSSQASGGEAWKFYSYVRMKFQRVKSEKGKIYNALTHKMEEQTVSSVIQAKVDKSKVSSSQHHKGEFYVVFGEGIDDLRTCIEVCCNHGKIQKGGAWYTYNRPDGSVIKSQGLASFREDLEKAKAVEEVKALAMSALQSANAATVAAPDEAEEMASTLANLIDNTDVDLDALLSEGDDSEASE